MAPLAGYDQGGVSVGPAEDGTSTAARPLDSQFAKRLKASLLETFPAALQQHQQQLVGRPAADAAPRPPQPATRRPARDQVSGGRPKIRRVLYVDPDDKAAGALPSPSLQQPYDPDFLAACYEDEAKGAVDWRCVSCRQPDVDAHRRLVLVDWLVEVVDDFKLSQSTLHLAVNFFDRYLAAAPAAVPRAGLQLVGAASLWLACKAEEVYPPTLGDFCDVTRHSCSAAALVEMERALLRELRFTLHVPTPLTFLALFMPAAAANAADADAFLSAAIDGDGAESDDSAASSGAGAGGAAAGGGGGGGRLPPADAAAGPRAAPRYPYPVGAPCASAPGRTGGALAVAPPGALGEFPRRLAHMAEYLCELALLTPDCLHFPPSLVASASLHLAASLLDAPPGTRSRLAPAADAAAARAGQGALFACLHELRRMYAYAATAPRPPSVKARYASQRRSGVSAMPPPAWALVEGA
ncbi:hypothetical protein Rsub_01145 [Raphidocelis subcapitata]|uniref:Uncharacterized protein n=1 Tax=Raphidocelis subcapitata TaxID=307507 RepID=A0A2V0NSB6_9CHLO|nr:hypothetical protein Rsub_01145 [Raphidocelis subcapitata]|eukprot:GBF88433.1 hypothetical protein Rsub_01145 [Raphidocelis subcapitata]